MNNGFVKLEQPGSNALAVISIDCLYAKTVNQEVERQYAARWIYRVVGQFVKSSFLSGLINQWFMVSDFSTL